MTFVETRLLIRFGLKAMMPLKSKKQRLVLTAVVAVLVLLCALVWPRPSSQPLRVSILSITNATDRGLAGAFRVENDLKETVLLTGLTYEEVSPSGWSVNLPDFAAFGVGERLSAGASSTFPMWVPTNGGPYRLVLHCYPEESVTRKRGSRFRWRIAGLLSRMNVSKRKVDHFVFGVRFPASLPFEVISSNQPGQDN